MPNYQNSKIYKIWSPQTELIYIGSTTQKLCSRIAGHKRENHYVSSKEILKYDDAKIELIENYACNSKEELLKREGELIRQNKDICVNLLKPILTPEEREIQKKECYIKWSNENKEYRKLYNKKRTLTIYNCICGSITSIKHKARHFKSLIHQDYLQDNLLHLLDL